MERKKKMRDRKVAGMARRAVTARVQLALEFGHF